jgi:MFS superfamily sulfate permease-like transporter
MTFITGMIIGVIIALIFACFFLIPGMIALTLKLADCPPDSSEARGIRSETDQLKKLSKT